MDWKKLEFWLAIVLVVYLLFVGLGAAAVMIINFPTESGGAITFPYDHEGKPKFIPFGPLGSTDQGLVLLALLAGVAGSFLHAAQSLSSYVGNADFKASWTAWYFLRPWIGGILGFAIYFAFRAGLVAGASVVNPHGVVALGLLGGWFSKTTTDKLQEVFETLFKTDQDKHRKDKLRAAAKPIVAKIDPSPIPAGTNEIEVQGHNFQEGATVLIDSEELQAEFVSETKLKVSLNQLSSRPAAGTAASIRVKNPEGIEPLSESRKVKFQ